MSMKDHNRRKIRVGQIAVVCIGAALLAVGGVLAAGTPGAEALPHLHAEAVETIQGNDVKEASLPVSYTHLDVYKRQVPGAAG